MDPHPEQHGLESRRAHRPHPDTGSGVVMGLIVFGLVLIGFSVWCRRLNRAGRPQDHLPGLVETLSPMGPAAAFDVGDPLVELDPASVMGLMREVEAIFEPLADEGFQPGQ
jgi:hypothetical protein